MESKFCLGLALGMLGGALIIANSQKAKKAVTAAQNKILDKITELKNKTSEQSEEE